MELLVVIVLGLLAAGGFGALVWAIVHYSNQYAQQIDTAWHQAAQQLGGRFQPVRGPWYKKEQRTLDARIGNVSVLADHYTVSTGKSSVTYTRIRCRAAAPPELALQASRKHFLSGLGQALGFQDVPTGHAAFDEAYTIKSNIPGLVPAWISREVRHAMAPLPSYGFALSDGEILARRTGLENDPVALVNVVRAVAALGDRGRVLLGTWRQLADALDGSLKTRYDTWMLDGSMSIQAAWHSVPITIDVVQQSSWLGGERTVFTRVRGRRVRGERFVLGSEYASGAPTGLVSLADPSVRGLAVFSDEPKRTQRRLSEATMRALSVVQPAKLEAEGDQIALLVYGVLTVPDHAVLATEVVGRLCVDEDLGPYR